MKILKWIDIQREIEVEITSEDLHVLYLEDEAETRQQVIRLLNRVAGVLKSIDPEMLEVEQLYVVYNGLQPLVAKFRPDDDYIKEQNEKA